MRRRIHDRCSGPRGGSSDEWLVRRGCGRPAWPGRHGGRAGPEAAAPGLERAAPEHAPGIAARPGRRRRPAPRAAPAPTPGPQRWRRPGSQGPPAPALGAPHRGRPAGPGRAAGRAGGLGRLAAQPGRRPDRLRRPAGRLIVGSDSRQGLDETRRRELGTGQAAGRRADTMMLLHIPRGTGKPVLISLPRDSYVPIPGHGRNKINAAYAFGGPTLLARTVEGVTGIRLDRYMEVGFDGFASVVDAVGGVQICPKTAMRDPMAGLNVKAVCQQANSRTALAYVRARHSGRGDLDRVQRQQEFLGSLIDKSTSPVILLNPFRSVPLLMSGTDAVAVDQAAHFWNLVRFPFAMRSIGNGGGIATTVPIAGSASVSGAGSVLQWDRDKALALFEALKRDQPVDTLVDQA